VDPLIFKIRGYLGPLSVIAGLAIAAAGTALDFFAGGLGFGDPLRGAIAVSMAAVIFGVFLVQFIANENLGNRIKELVHVNSSIKVEVPGVKSIKGIVKLVGMIVTPLSALAMIVIAFKDASSPGTFNIGTVKFFLLFGSCLMGFVGLGLMALYNQFLTNALHTATKKLKDLLKEQDKEIADLLEAAAKPPVVSPPQQSYYYQPQQSYYDYQQQAPAAPPQQTVEEPEPEPLPPPPKPKVKTPPPLPPPVVKMVPPPLPPPLKPKEKTLPPPIEPVKDNKTASTSVRAPKSLGTCPKCGKTVKSQWKICPFCGHDF
jgi:uncharacterized membrane protein